MTGFELQQFYMDIQGTAAYLALSKNTLFFQTGHVDS
jgi:hypothetical protein